MQAVEERNQVTEHSEANNDLGREPGDGAVEFAKPFIKGLSIADAQEVFSRLIRGKLHDTMDKRVKRCDYCQYFWRDGSTRNTKKTCCNVCHTGKKSRQKKVQRERQALLYPEKQPTRRHTTRDDYYDWLEYPYWLSEKSMIAYDTNYMTDADEPVELIEYIRGTNQIYGEGNRKVSTYHDNY